MADGSHLPRFVDKIRLQPGGQLTAITRRFTKGFERRVAASCRRDGRPTLEVVKATSAMASLRLGDAATSENPNEKNAFNQYVLEPRPGHR